MSSWAGCEYDKLSGLSMLGGYDMLGVLGVYDKLGELGMLGGYAMLIVYDKFGRVGHVW